NQSCSSFLNFICLHYLVLNRFLPRFLYIFFFIATPPTWIYTLSLHDALPIFCVLQSQTDLQHGFLGRDGRRQSGRSPQRAPRRRDRKSTRLNSSHVAISYAVFCLKKKK